jgi:hypothetical protein
MQIFIQALFDGSVPAIPVGITKASTRVIVTDGAVPPQVQTFELTGMETPPYSVSATVAAAKGSVTLMDIDLSGAIIGAPVTGTYGGAPPPPPVPGVSGVTITITAP